MKTFYATTAALATLTLATELESMIELGKSNLSSYDNDYFYDVFYFKDRCGMTCEVYDPIWWGPDELLGLSILIGAKDYGFDFWDADKD